MKYERKNQPERDNAGAIAQKLAQQTPDTRSPVELERAMQKDYMKNVWDCIARNKTIYGPSFYVVVLIKRERLMPNVIRNMYFARHSCPTPNYEQSVFYYNGKEDKLEFLWTIPDLDSCVSRLGQLHLIAKEEEQLTTFVKQFKNGELHLLAKQRNNEPLTEGEFNELKRRASAS